LACFRGHICPSCATAEASGSNRPFSSCREAQGDGIAIVRAAHLHVYLDELREIGVPVERALGSSRLPSWIEETPDAYVSIPLSLE
jgi:hypothetical protein